MTHASDTNRLRRRLKVRELAAMVSVVHADEADGAPSRKRREKKRKEHKKKKQEIDSEIGVKLTRKLAKEKGVGEWGEDDQGEDE